MTDTPAEMHRHMLLSTSRKRTASLPVPSDMYRKAIAAEKTSQLQRRETKEALVFIKTATPESYSIILASKIPTAVLIKVPGIHMVRFITGLSLYMGGLFSITAVGQSDIAGDFLAVIMQRRILILTVKHQ